MSDEVILVIETIVMLSLVILSGMMVRKIGLLDEGATKKLSNLVVDFAFPALVFTSMLRTIDSQRLAEYWHMPLIGLSIMLLGIGIGYLALPFLKRQKKESHHGSTAFVIGTPNWLFIPLPIAIALYGDDGERTVLLFNVGALLVFWSLGVWIVKGGKPDLNSLRTLAMNPGLLATLLGIVVALAFPWTRTLEGLDITNASLGLAVSSILIQAMVFVGDVTVPLAMVVTGSLLAGAGARKAWNRYVISISAIRLIAVPACIIFILWLADMIGIKMTSYLTTIIIITAAMPVAVTCSVVVEKYDKDVPLVTRAIFVSTIASVITIPVIVWIVRIIGL